MHSKRELEGYVLIDHRDSPGITPEQAALAGNGTMPVGRGMRFESATINCHVCKRLVILNPDRTRPRAYCPKHDAYSCDWCEAERVRTGECHPFQKVLDDFVDAAAKGHDVKPITDAFMARRSRLILPT